MTANLQVIPSERVEFHEPRFSLVPFNKLRPGSDPEYLVKGLIPAVGLTLVWGPPKSLKSFWVFDLMLHVALDWRYRGRRVKTGAVVYCALEATAGYHKRAEAFRLRKLAEHHGDVPLYLISARLTLVEDHPALVRSIRTQLATETPVAIVLDTLNRSLGGSESSDEHMGAYIKAADRIRDEFNCAVILVHHCGIDTKRPRGHTSLTAGIDCQLAVTRERGADTFTVEVEFQRDGVEGAKLVSNVESVQVGVDADDDPITSLIVLECEQPPASAKASGKANASPAQEIAMRALRHAIENEGYSSPASDHIPESSRVVTVDVWRQYAYDSGISSSKKPRARQVAFQRAHTALNAAGKVGAWDDLVWIPSL